MRKVLSVSLPQKLSSELDTFAKATGRRKSDIIKESISLYLWESRYRDIRKKLSIKAKRIGVVTDENVFKVVS
jgi:metal-responsive CopG/Arc/MetJ family transcriptional regulator